ncbi:MAG: LytR C-terminal domain-containing protein [Intrasporangium sp.]|uniref:LytR C-terminal domain-containing protein n=1 Tax=Intrasporangium sp. TaxID=1925024 RepID=UPI003F7F7418
MTAEDDDYEYRARRQRRATVTIAVLLLALAGAFYYASTYFRQPVPKPVAACTTVKPVEPLRPADVSVNVYNGTKRHGLAGSTSQALAKRGFKIKKVANDPLKQTITKSAEIRYGEPGKQSAELLAQQVPGAALVKDKRKDDTVDLVIGNAWKQLGPIPAEPAPTQTLPLCPNATSVP